MYLKALELQGFKSFPDKTRITFEKDVTAIVGPNGSGKSNIADAILWVMGEQRSRTLRGGKMEDVIFGGTEKRGALGFAQVSLIIDNAERIFDCDNTEIMLTRRYYRSGESEYYINREAVRLKDINSLLMDTGLGRDGYSIIGQGRIAEIVSSKSSDRRDVFEEAAGISRYRSRKEESERKLAKTEENLLRINDKIDELELQVEPLRRQSETAKKYLILRDELRVREISVWMASLDRLRSQAEAVNNDYENAKRELDEAHRSLEALYASSGNISERMHEKDMEAEKARERLSAAEGRAAECDARAAELRANIKSSGESVDRMKADITEAETRVREIGIQIEENQARITELTKTLSELSDKQNSSANVIEGCRMKLQSRENTAELLREKVSRLSVDCRSMDARIDMLSEMEKEYEGFSKAVKTVMRESARGNLRGVHGPVANLVKADNECALAIETALGAAMQNIVVDSQNDGRSAIEMLKRTDSGRATFLPTDTVRGAVMRDAPVNDPGFVGVAYDLVSFDVKYDGIFANLLGRTVVAETLADAVRMSKANGNRLRIVSLDGQLINAGGSMTGGSAAKGTGILSRANELEALKKRRAKLESDYNSASAELDKARTALSGLRYELDMALEDQAEILRDKASLEAEKRTTEAAVRQFELLMESLSGDSEQRYKAIEMAEASRKELGNELDAVLKQQKLIMAEAESIRAEISEIINKRLELEGRRTKTDKDTQERNRELLELERRCALFEQKKLAADMEEKQLLDKLWDNYELSHSAAQELRQPVENIQKETRGINDLRRQISALGTPNIGAIEEYERVSSRYEFLTGQRDDIEKAKKELLGIINDVTAEMQEVFLSQFNLIDEKFRETFLELFGGGKASILLEDETAPLDCGIEIKVQPPGKAVSNISLLSGGEKAFVAIALYFAILKVRPTPFCVMDEIEAALDETNVVRYADYMRRMCDRTQFIVITHRRGTMEEADHLYGVTMQEKGVSKIIELDLEQAQKTIETDIS